MTKQYSLVIVLLAFAGLSAVHAQFSRYIIRLKDKAGTPFSIANPSQFLTQRAINRRLRYGIAINETDLPVVPRYIDSIRSAGSVTILNHSRWMNQVCISTTDAAALAKINSFDFVLSSSAIAAKTTAAGEAVNKQLDAASTMRPAAPAEGQNVTDIYNYGGAYGQIHLHNGEFLHNLGFSGQGVQMAIIDDGFFNYQTLPNFDSARSNNQLLGTWDFVSNNSNVNDDDAHGMRCFSTIASNMPGAFVGTAPGASYYLYRTEDIASEYPVEEQNWLVAAERADSLGVDVISTSLGYATFDNNSFNHSYAELNGNTTLIARAANIAVTKGMLVVVAIGNEGNNGWHYLTTPGDADSVLTVGAVNVSGQTAGFSSYGPNSDGQVKPDVAAVGASAAVASNGNGLPVYSNGTSYACPIMAGISTCLWQAFPEIKNTDIMVGLRRSADRYNAPDDRTGYGVPDVKKAFVNLVGQLHTQSASINDCKATFSWNLKAATGMNVIVERMLPSDNSYIEISTINFAGAFANRVFSFVDSLGGYSSGVNIKYRIRMNIGTDTSFYIDSATLAYSSQCSPIVERKICLAAATYFSVDSLAPGYQYQWQVNTGSGFVNLADDGNYTGSATRVLILKNLPQTFYGNQYRCVQTNGSDVLYSTTVTLKFATEWTGAVNTAWENPANWSCGMVPTRYMDVLVDNSAVNFPVINSAAACHAIRTMPGASVTVKNGFRLEVAGN